MYDEAYKVYQSILAKIPSNSIDKPMKKIVSELTLLFPSAEKKDWGKYEFSEGHYFPITFDLNDFSRAMVACYNWNEESNSIDSLKVTLYSEKYQIYLSKQDQ